MVLETEVFKVRGDSYQEAHPKALAKAEMRELALTFEVREGQLGQKWYVLSDGINAMSIVKVPSTGIHSRTNWSWNIHSATQLHGFDPKGNACDILTSGHCFCDGSSTSNFDNYTEREIHDWLMVEFVSRFGMPAEKER